MPDPLVVIPARLAATRLPGKPLADLCGEPMIVHVWRIVRDADLGPAIVATDDRAIAEAVEAAGGRAVMTATHHASGSDRIFEAWRAIDPAGRHDVVVNVQGDLPTLAPASIGACLAPLEDPAVAIATLAAIIRNDAEAASADVVKVVGSPVGADRLRALYFSRAPVPWGDGPLYHHIGLYAYRAAALEKFVSLPPSPLERRERLEQLRALEASMRIDVALVDDVPLGVDTPRDLEKARAILAARRTSRG